LSVLTFIPTNPPPLDERFLTALYKGLVEAVFAVELNSQRIVYWNEGAEALFRFPKREIEQQPMARLFIDQPMADGLLAAALTELLEKGFWRGEGRCRRRDGSTFIADVTQALLKTDRGSHIVATVRDISENKERDHVIHWLNQQLAERFNERATAKIAQGNEPPRVENHRRQTDRLLDILMRNLTNSAILFLSTEGRVTLANKGTEQLLGYAVDEIEGMDLSKLFEGVAAAGENRTVLDRAQWPKNITEHNWLRCKDGSHFYARVEILPLRDDGDRVEGYLVLLRDDTEQKKIREQLREKDHLATIGTATAMLAHEIRNPLNGMSTTVQFLERSLQGDFEPTKEMVVDTIHDLKSEITRLQTLLGEFHALSHPQQLNSRPVDIAEIMRGLISLVLPESLKQKIEIVEQLDNGLPLISGDPDKLKQVFLNLIKNAFEAMPNGGTLTARVGNADQGVRVEISDTGVGIPDGLNVFDLFCSTKAHGTGLGLAIARQIILAHNGSIDYSSKVGMTTFRVTLPVAS
jgi:PAS domain S-box-containing protein